MKETKVFCIGFAKTGTTTLRKTLKSLGYTVAGYNEFRKFAGRDSVTYDELLDHAINVMTHEFDSCQDTPWSIMYKDLDRAFPGSKFIHVIRDSDAWINSAAGDFDTVQNPIHEVVYGSRAPKGNEAEWQAVYDRHNIEVPRYFAGREDDYLQLRLENLDFETVCTFVGEEYTGQKLPKANTRLQKNLKKILWKFTGTKQS